MNFKTIKYFFESLSEQLNQGIFFMSLFNYQLCFIKKIKAKKEKWSLKLSGRT